VSPFSRRLDEEFDREFSRLANDWYLKWHELARGEPIELDDFRGGRIRLGGMRYDAIAELAYWSAKERYAQRKIEEIFDHAEEEIHARAGLGREKIAEDTAIRLRAFLERLHRHAVFTEFRLQGRGYPDECYLDDRRDAAIAAKVQHRKMALIERYRSLPLRRKIGAAVTGFARGRGPLPRLILLAALLALLVFWVSQAATQGAGESAPF
jgi:hypothetical protein